MEVIDNNVENVTKYKELTPISHKDFKELKAMFGFKPLTKEGQVTVTIDNGKEFNTYQSILKASIGAGIPYTTLLQAKKKSKNASNPVPIRSGRNIYVVKFNPIQNATQ